jgi:hypothetical protein
LELRKGASRVIHQEASDHAVVVADAGPENAVGIQQNSGVLDAAGTQNHRPRADGNALAGRRRHFKSQNLRTIRICHDLRYGRPQQNSDIVGGFLKECWPKSHIVQRSPYVAAELPETMP